MSNELDKQIGDKLGGYESVVDGEALWQAVRPPRRRRPWFLLLLLFGAVIMAGGLWWATGNTETNTIDNQQVAEETTLGDSRVGEKGAAADHTVVAELATETLQENNASANTSLPQRASLPQSQNPNPSSTSSTSIVNSSSMATEAITVTQPTEDTPSSTEESIDVDDQSINTQQFNRSQELAIKEETVENESTFAPSQEQNEALNEVPLSKENRVVDVLPSRAMLLLPEKQEILVPSVLSPPRKSKSEGLFTQADGAYLMMQRTLENADSNASDWASRRLASEQVMEGISADLTFGYRNRNGWQFRTGLGYTQLNLVFKSTVVTQTVDTIHGLQALIYRPNGSVDSIIGPVPHYNITTREKRTYNSFRQWELPLLAGYNFDLGKLDLLVETGLRLQLNRTWEGTVLDEEGGAGFLDFSEQDWYRSGFSMSLQGGVQLAYPLTPKLDILAGGSVRYSLQDFSLDTAPFKERYQLLGGQLSLRYKL